MSQHSSAGGFLPPTLPSPPPSSPAASTAPSSVAELPTPRALPLRLDSAKADAVRRYAEAALLRISGRYERRFARQMIGSRDASGDSSGGSGRDSSRNEDSHRYSATVLPTAAPSRGAATANVTEDETGYASYGEVAADLERVVDVLWVTGTASIQIPFLLLVALAASDYLPAFPFAPRPTFSLLYKLDAVFEHLLGTSSLVTGGAGAGPGTPRSPALATAAIGGGRPLTTTEKVRLRGIVESTRVRVARQASDVWEGESEAGMVRAMEARVDDRMAQRDGARDTRNDDGGMDLDADDDGNDDMNLVSWEMDVARVYERTIVELGQLLDAVSIIGATDVVA